MRVLDDAMTHNSSLSILLLALFCAPLFPQVPGPGERANRDIAYTKSRTTE